jgi:putative membrane protein insertion efficiency factor
MTARRVGEALWHLPRRLLMLLVRAYRLLLKPWLGNACRFEPTCSAYALQALQQHGALAGAALSAGRVLRCHPWCDGGCDPVPDAPPRPFTRFGWARRDPSFDDKS